MPSAKSSKVDARKKATPKAQQKAQAQQFRALLLDAVRPYQGLPLMLSGGVDSGTALAALLALGAPPPRCYTFQLGNRVSSDLAVARAMCAHFGVPHTVAVIPQTEATLLRDIRRVLPLLAQLKKVHVQVAQCFLYLGEAARADGYDHALIAMAADDLWGTARAISAYVRTRGEEWCRAMRREYITYVGGSDESTRRASSSVGVALTDVWASQPLIDFMLSLDYADLHTPVAKGLALRAFPEFWQAGAWYRPNSSLQVNSGVREWHDTLLANPALNTRGHKAIIGLYRQLAQELRLGPDHYMRAHVARVSSSLSSEYGEKEREEEDASEEEGSATGATARSMARSRSPLRTTHPSSRSRSSSSRAPSTGTASSRVGR